MLFLLFFLLSRVINQLEFIGIVLEKNFSVAVICDGILLLDGDQFVVAFNSFEVDERLAFRQNGSLDDEKVFFVVNYRLMA